MNEFEIPKPPLERKWIVCPHCGSKVCIHDNTAECKGVFMKCTRNSRCKKEFELVIKKGVQELSRDAVLVTETEG